MPKLKIFVAVVIVSLVAVFPMLYPTRSQLMNTQKMRSIRILDRHGIILREILSRNDATSQYCKLGDISPWLIKTTLNTEDRRFFSHKGIDPLALVRSIVLNIVQGDIVTGGSTITQQLARNMLGSPSRSFVFKSIEAFVALNLELKLQKKEILELYFNYAPYGNQTFGVEAASYLYFRKPARDLSLPEACFLAGIPKAPSYLDPYRYPERIIAEQRRILDRLYNNAVIDSVTYYDALSQPIHVVPKESNFNAPHFCQYVLRRLDQKGYYNVESVVTTLNIHLQRDVEQIVKNNIKRLEDANVTNAAAVVIDNRTMEILAYVGSVDFFDPLISGEVDGVRSLRQPGSALKPFTYALALEHGATAATLIPDVPTYEYSWGGDYTPHNYDEKYHGMVRLRTALACSYNIPAVKACGKFGPEKLLEKLKLAGFSSLGKSPVYYGLGLTLGTGEVTLLELTSAFSLFAHYGFYQPERILLKIDTTRIGRTPSVTVFDPGTAYIIMDILSDNSARSPAFGEFSPLNMPFFCAAKTGTSKDFRDNWCIGFTDKYLIGVWVGNFDGSPMNHVSGITGAGPLFRDIMLCVHKDIPSKKPRTPSMIVKNTICTITGEAASVHCHNTMDEIFVKGSEPKTVCSSHPSPEVITASSNAFDNVFIKPKNALVITFPDNGDIFKVDPILRDEYQVLTMRIQSPHTLREVTWFVDDAAIARVGYPFTTQWTLTPGKHRICAHAVTDENQTLKSDPVSIVVLK